MTPLTRFSLLVLLGAIIASPAAAQTPSAPTAAAEGANTPVRIHVVIARFQGDKRISSLPYTLFAQMQNRDRGVAQLRMGADVPIWIGGSSKPSGGASEDSSPRLQYERLGTEIDCFVRPSFDGRYIVELTVSDRTVYAEDQTPRLAPGSIQTLRSFRAYNAFVLKDGQSTQFNAAADRITGEVVRIEATLEVVK